MDGQCSNRLLCMFHVLFPLSFVIILLPLNVKLDFVRIIIFNGITANTALRQCYRVL